MALTLIIALIAMALGALWCFFGWRFFLLLLPLWGFLVGFNVGTEAVAALFNEGTLATVTGWAVGFVLAVVFAVLSWLWWYFAVAIVAGSLGFALGQAAWGIIGNEAGVIAFVLGLVVAAVFVIAILALNVPRLLVIAFSALSGSAAVLAGWFILTGAIPAEAIQWAQVGSKIADNFIYLVAWLAIAVAGIVAQLQIPDFGPRQYEYSKDTYRY